MKLYIYIEVLNYKATKSHFQSITIDIENPFKMKESIINTCISIFRNCEILGYKLICRKDGNCNTVPSQLYKKETIYLNL